MVLYLIGLGLGDERDITMKGLDCVKSCEKLYLEHYTSVLGVDKNKLEFFYGVSITLADRNMVELEADNIYLQAKDKNIGFLVVGDPLCATTHTDLILRARALDIPVEVIHNTSVMGAVASCGLQLYKFGYTVSIPLFEGNWTPDSFYDRIKYNSNGGMHSLCLLDIKVKEADYDSLVSFGKVVYLPPRFMTVNKAIKQMLLIENSRQEGLLTIDTLAVGVARLGQKSQKIVFGKLNELLLVDFGEPLHSLVICGEIHPLESEILEYYRVKSEDMTYIDEEEDNDNEDNDHVN